MKLKLLAASLGLAAATPASAAWQEASSRHFIVYSDDTPANVAAYTTKLERFDKALRVLRNVADDPVSPMARVTVFVVPNIHAVQRLGGKGLGDVAGFYVPRASQTVAFVPRRSGDEDLSALVILLHEYSHHFMFTTWGRAAFPAWLVEGFAEFNATAMFAPDGSIMLGKSANYRAFGILDNQTMPLKRLLTADPDDMKNDEERATFYARAWLFTHYMMLDKARSAQLGAYFDAINRGQSSADAAKLLGDTGKLDQQLNTYVMRPRLSVFMLPASSLAIEPVRVHALSAGEAAIMPARIASVRGVNARTASGVVTLARQLAAPYPADPAAQNELAEAEYDAGNWAASQAAAGRALDADPKSIHAMIYQGMARAGAAAAAKATDVATWKEVRRWYAQANHLDPEYAWPLELFYGSFVAARQPPTASAQAGLLYAHDLAPFDMSLGLNAAYVLLQQNKPDEATAVLRPIAYNPHAESYAETATKVMAEVKKNGAAAAVAMIDQLATTPKAAGKDDQ